MSKTHETGHAALFGEHIKQLRLKRLYSLRSFCLEYGYDAGNHSRLERGLALPKLDDKWLTTLAESLGIEHDTPEMQEFFDLAYLTKGQVPEYILSDEEIVKKLPAVFRKFDSLTSDKFNELIELIRST